MLSTGAITFRLLESRVVFFRTLDRFHCIISVSSCGIIAANFDQAGKNLMFLFTLWHYHFVP